MDLAKSVTAWKEQSPEQWIGSANRVLPPVVMAVLVLAIAYRLAELTWAVIPHHAFDSPSPQIVQPAAPEDGRTAANFSVLEDSDLFGKANVEAEAPAQPVAAEIEAPDTRLNLRLTGVTADENGKLSQAHIISGRDEERNYALGEEIDNANGATLERVYPDRVILNVGGRFETLRFPELASTSASAGRVARPQPAAAAPAEDVSLRDVVTENSSSLTNIMRIAPAIEGGQMVGVRVNPGRDRETFEALGLMPGDIVTDINGIVIDDPSRALQVFEALGESSQASVTIMRDGVPTVLVIDTTQIQSLMDDRQ